MRRSLRSAENPGLSEQVPTSNAAEEIKLVEGVLPHGRVPKFGFTQSSPHANTSTVNGESETVHYVVKARPFTIRVYEVPTLSKTSAAKEGEVKQDTETDELTWPEVKAVVGLVFPKTHVPFRSASGQAPLTVERSVVLGSSYNHRRSSNPYHDQPGDLLLKQGAGLELSVRLAVLSSHLRSDFCVHIKLVIRGAVCAEWYSENIHCVSKWDKVRHLRDNTVLPSSKPKQPRIAVAPSSSSTPKSLVSRFAKPQATQKPASLALTKFDNMAASTLDSQNKPPFVPKTGPAHEAEAPFDDVDEDSLVEDAVLPSVPSSASQDAPMPTQTSDMAHLSSTPIETGAPRAKRNASNLSAAFTDADDDYSASSSGKPKRKKATSDEVFAMLAKLEHMHSQLAKMASSKSKKRKAQDSWTDLPAVTSEGPVSVPQFKKRKLTDPTEEAVHSLPPLATTVNSATLASQANLFLSQLDHSSVADVRSALKSLLLTRPHLAAILQRLMNTPSKPSASAPAVSPALQSSLAAYHWPTADLNNSGYLLTNWNDDEHRYAQDMSDQLERAAPLQVATCSTPNSALFSPSAMDDSESTSVSSPSWSDDWTEPDVDSSCPMPLLTQSVMFPVYAATPADF